MWFEYRSDVTEWNLINRASEGPLRTTVDHCWRFDNLTESLRTRTLQSQVLRFDTEDDFRTTTTTTAVLGIVNLLSFPIQLTWYSREFFFCLFIIYAHFCTGCSLGYHHVVFLLWKQNVQAKSICWSNSVWGLRSCLPKASINSRTRSFGVRSFCTNWDRKHKSFEQLRKIVV